MFTGIYNWKTLGKVITIFKILLFQDKILKQFWYCYIDSTGTHDNLGTQIKSLYKSVSVGNGNLFVSYENW